MQRILTWSFLAVSVLWFFGAEPAKASSFFECKGEGVVLSAKPASPEATKDNPDHKWDLQVRIKSMYKNIVTNPSCAMGSLDATVQSPVEKAKDEIIRVNYMSYSAMTPNGPMSSKTWTLAEE